MKQGYFTPAFGLRRLILGFADAEHPGPALCADTLGARFAVLHSDGFDILHFPDGQAFHAVCFHNLASRIFTLIIAADLMLVKQLYDLLLCHAGFKDDTMLLSENQHRLCLFHLWNGRQTRGCSKL